VEHRRRRLRNRLEQPAEQGRVPSRKLKKGLTYPHGPRALVGEDRQPVDKRTELDASTERSQAQELQSTSQHELSTREFDGFAQRFRGGRRAGQADDSPSVATGIVKSPARGIDEQLVAGRERHSKRLPVRLKGHALSFQHPRQGLALADDEKVARTHAPDYQVSGGGGMNGLFRPAATARLDVLVPNAPVIEAVAFEGPLELLHRRTGV
jgi:hypothetical protein